MNLFGLLADVSPEILRPVAILIGGIIRVVRAGESASAREDALMQTAEDMKAELDRIKFGAPDTTPGG